MPPKARVAKLVDATDLKSVVLRDVPVRFRPRAPYSFESIRFNLFQIPSKSNTYSGLASLAVLQFASVSIFLHQFQPFLTPCIFILWGTLGVILSVV
jgi:hypothetical protein